MITNPGGQLSPDEIFGRDDLIEGLWRILEGRCIYMNDLRRIGKTQIMVKMKAEAPNHWLCVKRDLGGCHSAAEFARYVYADSAEVLKGGFAKMRRMKDLLGQAAGTEIAGVLRLPGGEIAPWKEILERTFRDVNENAKADGKRMLFFWDEVPFLLDNVAKRESPQVAMEVLDVIRSLTQNYDNVRVFLTGSIGLHHILKTLKKSGYSGSPLNRMELVRPGPLAHDDAVQLAKHLLVGEKLKCDDLDNCAKSVANSVGCVPFYIHKLISRLDKDNSQSEKTLLAVLDREIAEVNNDWDLEHYRDRLRDYYSDDERFVLAILDTVAASGEITFDQVRSNVGSKIEKLDEEQLRDTIKLLCKDHYLQHGQNGTYKFYLGIVARWWRISRDLKQGA